MYGFACLRGFFARVWYLEMRGFAGLRGFFQKKNPKKRGFAGFFARVFFARVWSSKCAGSRVCAGFFSAGFAGFAGTRRSTLVMTFTVKNERTQSIDRCFRICYVVSFAIFNGIYGNLETNDQTLRFCVE